MLLSFSNSHSPPLLFLLVEMSFESATPGGLNEQSVNYLRGTEFYELHEHVSLLLSPSSLTPLICSLWTTFRSD
jgi:hypothetical protein